VYAGTAAGARSPALDPSRDLELCLDPGRDRDYGRDRDPDRDPHPDPDLRGDA